MFNKVVLGFVLLGMSTIVSAGTVAENATILKVRNTANNADAFEVVVDSANEACANQVIRFPLSSAASSNAHMRAYSSVLTALTTGMKVRIHSYETANECITASYIELSK